ncbi:MAG TPA: DNA replication and repair protein RecF [Acidiferrobacter sp.]|nr:DNA replication and repair protein RecF [Acidiferrobacter sp.]
MAIRALEIEDLRCLEKCVWEPSERVNVVVGENGAGKTSLLEAVVLAATGRALRSGSSRAAIAYNAKRLRVRVGFGKALSAGTLVYERSPQARVWLLNDEAVRSTIRVYEQLPILVFSPESHYAALQDAQVRRTTMHWLLFHVEPLFLDTWRRYQRVLKQRNMALRNKDATYRMFDPGLCQTGEVLAGFWSVNQKALQEPFQRLAARLRLTIPVEMVLYPGWQGKSFMEALSQAHLGDERLGYTQLGPHRSDIRFLLGGRPIQQVASHGQQKVIINAWRLALAQAVQAAGKEPLVLVDDLAAELDSERRHAFYEELSTSEVQALVTAIERDDLPSSATMFHVEHGCLHQS